jgi:nucleoid DNA-binding protein
MSRCIIHIGMHKTGSTSIQWSLEGFEDNRFFYARLGNGGNHSLPIYSMFMNNPERHHLHRAGGRDPESVQAYIEQVRADLDRTIVAAQGRTLLISGEDISVLPKPHLAKLRDYFGGRFEDMTIVGYVRPPAAYMASNFQQRARHAWLESVEPKAMYRNYQETFGKFDHVFGREKVQLWKFDPGVFPDGCVVQDLCARIGVVLPKERIVRLNESASRQAIAALYTYGKLGGEHGSRTLTGAECLKLSNLIGGSGKFRFSPDAVRPVLEANRSDIEWMEARLGHSLNEDLDERRPTDVRDESDLMRPDSELVSKLLTLLGDAAPEGVKGETPQEVGRLVHALRGKYAVNSKHVAQGRQRERRWWHRKAARQERALAPAEQRDAPIPISDLIDQIRQKDANLLRGISRDEAQGLVSNVFKYLNEKLAGTEEGVVSIAGLGRFRVRRGEANAGRKGSLGARIVFLPTGRKGGSL